MAKAMQAQILAPKAFGIFANALKTTRFTLTILRDDSAFLSLA
jgi:hypothetical protein